MVMPSLCCRFVQGGTRRSRTILLSVSKAEPLFPEQGSLQRFYGHGTDTGCCTASVHAGRHFRNAFGTGVEVMFTSRFAVICLRKGLDYEVASMGQARSTNPRHAFAQAAAMGIRSGGNGLNSGYASNGISGMAVSVQGSTLKQVGSTGGMSI